MPNPALNGARSKIGRARDHLKNFEAIFDELHPSEHNSPAGGFHYNHERQELIITHPKIAPPDPSFPLIIGDCVHNARSALDHVVFQLAVLNNAPVEAATRVTFPVCLKSGDFQNATKNVRPYISASALTEIEKLQPYAAGNAGKDDVLWVLSQLDIIDKHRLLIVAVSKFRTQKFWVTVPTGEQFSNEIEGAWKTTEDGAEMIRFDLSHAIRESGKVDVKLEATRSIQITNTGLDCDGRFVPLVLGDCIQHVINIIDAFGKMFFGE